MPIDDFIELLNDEIDGKIRAKTIGFAQNGRMVLGGAAGPFGGSGTPPGGFIGQLTQGYIAYDTTEAAVSGGASSLVDNLNHIRYDVSVISGILVSGVVTEFRTLSDTPDSYEGFENSIVVISPDADGLVYSGGISRLNYSELQLNPTVNSDFIFSKDLDLLETAPDLVFQTPSTLSDRGKILFRDSSATPATPKPLTVGSTGYSTPGDTTSAVLSHTIGDHDNRVLVVGVAIRGGQSVTSVTFGAETFTKAGHVQPGGDIRSEIWYLAAPTVGTADITVTLAGSQTFAFSTTDFYNVDSIGSYSSTSGNAAGVTTTKGATTNQIYDCLALQSENASITVTIGNTEQTQLTAQHPTSVSIGTSIVEGSATSDSSWTFSSDYYAISFLELNEIIILESTGVTTLELDGSTATFAGNVVLASGTLSVNNNVTISDGVLTVSNNIVDGGSIAENLTISGGVLDASTSVGNIVISSKASPEVSGKIIFEQGTIASSTLLGAVEIDTTTYELGVTTGAYTKEVTVGDHAGRGLLVTFTSISGSPGASSVTYGGVALTRIKSTTYVTGYPYSQAYYLASPAVGTATLSVTRSATHVIQVGIMSLYNINSYDVTQYYAGSSSGGVSSINVTDTSFSVSIFAHHLATAITVGDNQTTLFATDGAAVSYAVTPEDMNYSFSTDDIVAHSVIKFYGIPLTADRYTSAEFDSSGILQIYKGISVAAENLGITTSGEVTKLNSNYLQGYTAAELLSVTGHTHFSEDLTSQVPAVSGIYVLENELILGTTKVYINGLRQRPVYYSVSGLYITFSGTLYSGDTVLVDYTTLFGG